MALLPPRCFYDAIPFSDAKKRELQEIEHNVLRATGLAQVVGTLKYKCVAANANIQRMKAERDNAMTEKKQAKEELQAAKAEAGKINEELQMIREAFEKANSDLVQSQKS